MMELKSYQLEVLSLTRKIWEIAPDLRFLQLIGNCFGRVSLGDIYFVSDMDFLQGLRCTYADMLKNKHV